MSVEIFNYHAIKPFESLGLTNNFWTIHIDILMATWIAMGIILCLALLGRYYLTKESNPIAVGYEQVISMFLGLCKDSFSPFNYYYFAFITSIFFFTFFSCLVGIIPFVEEATRDMNTTLAIGLTSFLYVQYQKINVHGIWGYLKEFAEPFFPLVPIHIVGELSKIASMSFRLFGNILGGGVILTMVIELLNVYKIPFMGFMVVTLLLLLLISTVATPEKFPRLNKITHFCLNVLFIISWFQITLGIAEGLIQSFVITMLTLTYLAIGTQSEQSPNAIKEDV
jgi:F-type H+-transporting ATPase subunit a